jgi:hypothetical protein
VELFNNNTRVVLEPNAGGRVLYYEHNNRNVIYLDPQHDGWIYEPGKPYGRLSGGRCDFGPEMTGKKHPLLFAGKWEVMITGPREAIMISQKDSVTGVQLVRKFELDATSSYLKFTQIIKNISDETKYYYHWSRTFVKGGGISLTPLNPNSRYPKGYLLYGPHNVIDFVPEEENVSERDGILEITGITSREKFVMDLSDGWLAYISKEDQLFIKRFEVFTDRVYGDLTCNNASVWYYRDLICEIEPMGPRETILAGGEASFTEHWWLFDYEYPMDRKADLSEITKIVDMCR